MIEEEVVSISTLLRGEALARAIAERAPGERDAFVDHLLGIPAEPRDDRYAAGSSAPCERIDFVPSGVSAIADAVLKARIGPRDTFVDVGAGLGRVAAIVHLLTGARAIGIELQPGMVERGESWIAAGGLSDAVELVCADALEADLSRGSVFYLYLPFIGETQRRFLARLAQVARARQIAVCTLGVDLRDAAWLRPTDESALWLAVYESAFEGAAPRGIAEVALPSLACVAAEQRLQPGSVAGA